MALLALWRALLAGLLLSSSLFATTHSRDLLCFFRHVTTLSPASLPPSEAGSEPDPDLRLRKGADKVEAQTQRREWSCLEPGWDWNLLAPSTVAGRSRLRSQALSCLGPSHTYHNPPPPLDSSWSPHCAQHITPQARSHTPNDGTSCQPMTRHVPEVDIGSEGSPLTSRRPVLALESDRVMWSSSQIQEVNPESTLGGVTPCTS